MTKWLNLATGGYASLVLYSIAAVAIAAAFGWTYHSGYSSAATAWSLKYDQREVAIVAATNAEISRIFEANARAKAIEAKRLAELDAANAALEAHIKELSDEANADPDRDRVCLSDGSGLRIDSVR
jgi:cell division protein FtsB